MASGPWPNAAKLVILRRSGRVPEPMCLGPVGCGGCWSAGAAGRRLTDHISLGVLSAAFSRDLIEEVIGAAGEYIGLVL